MNEGVQLLPLSELRARGFDVLVKELGPANALRFLGLYESGHGDYTAEREERIAGATIEDIEREIQEMRRKGAI